MLTRFHWSILELNALICIYFIWFTSRFNIKFLKCTEDYNTYFDFERKSPGIFAANINNTQQLYVCKISAPNTIVIRWVYYTPLKFISWGIFLIHLAGSWSSEIPVPLSVWVLVSPVFLSKNCKPLIQVRIDIHHTLYY